MWLVAVPGEATLNISYSNASLGRLGTGDYLGVNISSTLTELVDQERIEAIIVLTVLDIPDVNGTVVECSIAELDSKVADVYINKSGSYLATNHASSHI